MAWLGDRDHDLVPDRPKIVTSPNTHYVEDYHLYFINWELKIKNDIDWRKTIC